MEIKKNGKKRGPRAAGGVVAGGPGLPMIAQIHGGVRSFRGVVAYCLGEKRLGEDESREDRDPEQAVDGLDAERLLPSREKRARDLQKKLDRPLARLLHHSHILTITGESYRLRQVTICSASHRSSSTSAALADASCS